MELGGFGGKGLLLLSIQCQNNNNTTTRLETLEQHGQFIPLFLVSYFLFVHSHFM